MLATLAVALSLAAPAEAYLPGPAPVLVNPDAGGALARAGLMAEDRILGWSRGDAGGPLRSWFDLLDVEVQEGPRGTVTLEVERNGVPTSARVSPASWAFEARPAAAPAQPSLSETVVRNVGDPAALAAELESRARAQPESDVEMRSWLLLASVYPFAKSGDTASAERVAREAVGLASQERHAGAAASIAARGARFLILYGSIPAARRLLEETAEEIAGFDPDGMATAMIRVRTSMSMHQTGIPELIREPALQALPVIEQLAPESGLMASLLESLGAAMKEDDPNESRRLHERGLEILKCVAPGSWELIRSFGYLGQVALARRDLDEAEYLIGEALALSERLRPGGNYSLTARMDLGYVSLRRFDLDDAEDHLRGALEGYEKAALRDPNQGLVLHGLGIISEARGHHEAAREYFARSLAFVREITPGSTELVGILRSMAEQDRLLGNLDQAEATLTEALELSGRLNQGAGGDPYVVASLGSLALERGDPVAASRWLEQARMSWRRWAPGSSDEAETLHALGELRKRANDPEGAASLFGEALDDLEAQRSRLGASEDASSVLSGRFARYYMDQMDTLLSLHRNDEAWVVSERYRAQALQTRLAERDLTASDQIPLELTKERQRIERAMDAVLENLRRLPPGPAEGEEGLLTELRGFRRDYAQLTDRIRRASPRFAAIRYPEALGFDAARRSLDPGTLLLSYSVGTSHTILFAVEAESGKLGTFEIAISESDLRERVRRYRTAIEPGGGGRDAAEGLARELFDVLIAPVAPQVRQARRVVVLPDGPLHRLPFGALALPGGKGFLAQWKPLHLAPSATLYAELRRLRSDHPAIAVVAFGDPTYPASFDPASQSGGDVAVNRAVGQGRKLVALPGSRKEAQGIGALFPGRSTVYLGDEATEERVKSLPRNVGVVHFACHALLNERTPLDSALLLALPPRVEPGRDNGLLQAREIIDGMTLDADLVTLSACETGLGAERGGEGLVGLTQAFFCAGARSVVAALWSISDDSTAELMRRFYTGLRRGKPKDEALRAAQAGMARAGYTPFQWAGFQLNGDWR